MIRPRKALPAEAQGLTTRRIAAEILEAVLRKRQPLDEQFDGALAHPGLAALEERDRALARMLVATVLRRIGTLRHLLGQYLTEGFPEDAPRVESALLIGAAQILWLDVPDHAAVDLSVRLVQADRRAGRYPGLINAVLRRVAREAPAQIDEIVAQRLDIPAWLRDRWKKHYGDETADAIAEALSHPPPFDITVKADPEEWARHLHGMVLPTGTVRTVAHGAVSRLPGYTEGMWWVQDAAAALPARLLGDVRGKSVVDLCAAPGGKAAQLAYAGGEVTVVDRSAARLEKLAANFTRLGLTATTVTADAGALEAGPFDAVLLDPPCLATGTIRRHPDVAWLKRETDLVALAALQQRLLDRAVELTRPGGQIVYCTCSLEPEEGEHQIEALLARDPRVRRRPVAPEEVSGLNSLITEAGDVRTLPCHLPHEDPRMAGLDGFYAARLERTA